MKGILLAALVLLAACGGKPEHPQVRIANVGNGLQTWCMPITLAESLGYYRDEGLDARIENLSSGVKALEALVGGSADAAGIPYPHTIELAAQGQRLRSIFVAGLRGSTVVAVAPQATGNIRRVEDLKGRLIGVPSPGSSADRWARSYLGLNGLKPEDYRVVSIGLGAKALAAMETGRVAAAALSGGDHFALLRRHPDARVLIDASTPEGMRTSYGSATFAVGTLSPRQDWLDRNPETARKLARAVNRARQWALTHTPEEIRAILPESFHSQDAALDCQIIDWGRATYTSDGRMPEGAPEAVKRYLDATLDNMRSAKIDIAATWTNEYLQESK